MKLIKFLALFCLVFSTTICGYGQANSLSDAAKKGDTSKIKSILEGGVNIDALNNEGMTALMVAAKYGQTDAIRVLVGHGANIEAKSYTGYDALSYAAKELNFYQPDIKIKKYIRVEYAKISTTIQVLVNLGAKPSLAACYIDPNYMEVAPVSITILPIVDLRTTDEKKKNPQLAEEFQTSAANTFKTRKYDIEPAEEAQKKIELNKNDSTYQFLGTDAVLQIKLLASAKINSIVIRSSAIALDVSLIDCKTGRILWKSSQNYSESRGFIIAAMVSGTRMISDEMAGSLPNCPKEKRGN